MDTRYQVTWCVETGKSDDGEWDPDSDIYKFRNFPTFGLSQSFAAEIQPSSFYDVRMSKQVFTKTDEFGNIYSFRDWHDFGAWELDQADLKLYRYDI